MSFAATLAAELCRTGSSDVFLVAADPQPRITGGPGSAALLQDIMERLALIDADARDHVPELLQLAAERIEPGTDIVLVSTRPLDLAHADYAGRLPGEVVRRLGGRGLRIVDCSSDEPCTLLPGRVRKPQLFWMGLMGPMRPMGLMGVCSSHRSHKSQKSHRSH